MAGRLHDVELIEPIVPREARSGGASYQTQQKAPANAQQEFSKELERLCLRAERDGPKAMVQLMPRLKQHLTQSPHDAQAWAWLARADVANDDKTQALRHAQEAVRLDPQIVLGHSLSLLVARSCADARRWDAAARHCEAALASHPGDIEALEMLVRALFDQGMHDKAQATLKVLSSSNADRAVSLARMLSERSRTSLEQYRWLSKAVELAKSDDDNPPLRELGEVCLVLQRDREALEFFQRAFSRPKGAEDVDLALNLAQLHLRAGRTDSALEVYCTCLAAVPDSLRLLRSYWHLLLKEGRTSQAIDVIGQAARIAPTKEAASLHATRAELLQSMGSTSDALNAWEAAVGADEGNTALWRGLATTASAAGFMVEQLRALRRMVKLEAQNPEWHAKLGVALVGSDPSVREREEARSHLKKAMELAPTHTLALLGMARLSKHEGQEELSLEYHERAAGADPACEEALEGAAALRWSTGDRRKAVIWYQKLLELRPNDPMTLCRLAVAKLHDQNACEALTYLQRAVQGEHPPDEATAWLGYARLVLGQVDRASGPLQTAKKNAPGARSQLHWSLLLMERGDEEAAHEAFAKAVEQHSKLQRLVKEPALQASVARGSVSEAGLAEDLPGSGPRLSSHLHMLIQRFGGSKGASTATARPKEVSSGTTASGGPAAPAAPMVMTPGSSSSVAASTSNTSDSSWRKTLHEGQSVEVYSKSVGKWLPSVVTIVNPETVQVKYSVDGQPSVKTLLRSSDSLRLPEDTVNGFQPPSRTGLMPPKDTSGSLAASPLSSPGPAGTRGVRDGVPQVPHLAGNRTPPFTRTPISSPGAVPPAPQAATQLPPQAQQQQAPQRRAWTQQAPAAQPSVAAAGQPFAGHSPEGGARRQWTAAAAAPSPKPTPSPARSSKQPDEVGLLDEAQLVFGKVLGSGGFGSVYRGTYKGEEVAIKKLHTDGGAVTPVQIDEFKKEVDILTALRHHRLVKFHGAAFTPPNLCMVLEFMPNGSLYELLHSKKDEPLAFLDKLNIATQITEGIEFLHGRTPPFVHRDLKSMNVILDFHLNIKLCDFGLTQSMEKTHITRRGDNEGGSPRYMAPELFDNRGKITEKVDIWALGCLVLEIFTRSLPHADCSSIQQVITKSLVRKEKPFDSQAKGTVSDELWTMSELCLEFNPKGRLDAAMFLEGLRSISG